MNMAANNHQPEFLELESIFPGVHDDPKKLANYLGLSGQEFAQLIEVDPSQVSKNEIGKDNPKVKKVLKLLSTLMHIASAHSKTSAPAEIQKKVMSWLKTANPAFSLETPVELLKKGKLRKLQAYAEDLLGTLHP